MPRDREARAPSRERETVKKAVAAVAEKRAPPPRESPDYGVPALAEHMGIQPASVRVLLRNAGIEKDGGTYDFKNEKGIAAIAKQLRAEGAPAAKEPEPPPPPARRGRR